MNETTMNETKLDLMRANVYALVALTDAASKLRSTPRVERAHEELAELCLAAAKELREEVAKS